MTNTGSSKKRGDSSSSDEGVSEIDNKYSRRANRPIKPVHNRANNQNEYGKDHFAYEPVN